MPTLATAARNAAIAAVANLIDAGAAAGKLKIKDASTVLATITLADPAFGSPATGVVTGASFPRSDTSADASGDADNFELTDSDDTVVVSGTVGTSGADINLDNTSINATQNVTINSLTMTQPSS